MKKCTSFSNLLQVLVREQDLQPFIDKAGYREKGRKCKLYDLFLFLAQAAHQQWRSFRDGAVRGPSCGLKNLDYSTLSKKAKEVPFEIFKDLLHLLVSRCNRPTRRRLRLPKELLLIDSTQITVGKGRMPWAPIQGSKAGVKLHTAYTPSTGMPLAITETTGKIHDAKPSEQLVDKRYIAVADRAYGKHKTFDQYRRDRQFFVIRIRDNTYLHEPEVHRQKHPAHSPILRDLTCQLGVATRRSELRHRVVIVSDGKGGEIWLATNLRYSAERIAEIYKERWQIELFFRWIKQHLNVPRLFGKTPNAVYSQLYVALIVYVIMKWIYNNAGERVELGPRLTFAQFMRLLSIDHLPAPWLVSIQLSLQDLPRSG